MSRQFSAYLSPNPNPNPNRNPIPNPNPNQFSAYLNRFDAGLVIYWFGFVDEVAALDPRILVLDHFPEDCTLMRGSGSPTLARRAIASDVEAALGNEQ